MKMVDAYYESGRWTITFDRPVTSGGVFKCSLLPAVVDISIRTVPNFGDGWTLMGDNWDTTIVQMAPKSSLSSHGGQLTFELSPFSVAARLHGCNYTRAEAIDRISEWFRWYDQEDIVAAVNLAYESPSPRSGVAGYPYSLAEVISEVRDLLRTLEAAQRAGRDVSSVRATMKQVGSLLVGMKN